jgi:hypothetical protein
VLACVLVRWISDFTLGTVFATLLCVMLAGFQLGRPTPTSPSDNGQRIVPARWWNTQLITGLAVLTLGLFMPWQAHVSALLAWGAALTVRAFHTN